MVKYIMLAFVIFAAILLILSVSLGNRDYETLNISLVNNRDTDLHSLKIYTRKHTQAVKKLNSGSIIELQIEVVGDMSLSLSFEEDGKEYHYDNIGYFSHGMCSRCCAQFVFEKNKILFGSDFSNVCKTDITTSILTGPTNKEVR